MCMQVCTTKIAAFVLACSSKIHWELSSLSLTCPTFGRGHLFCLHNSFRWTLYAGGTAPGLMRTKAFCLASLAPMQVELEGRSLYVLQLYPVQIMGLFFALVLESAIQLSKLIILWFKEAEHWVIFAEVSMQLTQRDSNVSQYHNC